MPMDLSRYPKNWRAIATGIKNQADWHCDNCRRPCRRPGESWDEFKERLPPKWDLYEEFETEEFGVVEIPKFNRFILTVAHLNHTPEDCRPENLRALCTVCHLRYDSRSGKKFRRREAQGQLQLFS